MAEAVAAEAAVGRDAVAAAGVIEEDLAAAVSLRPFAMDTDRPLTCARLL